MRLPAGRALQGVYDEAGGPVAGRRLGFVAEPSGRFVLTTDDGIEACCDGRTVWVIEDGSACFTGPVPDGDAAAFGLLPSLVAELLHPASDYIDAAFSDPGTTDEELELGRVRISGSALSIVYDRSIDVVHEYRRPDGLQRRLDDIAVVQADDTLFGWAGAIDAAGHGTVVISTTEPVTSTESARVASCFAAHLEHDCEVLAYWLDGPGLGTGGVTADECLTWAAGLGADVTISVDLVSGETVALAAADW